MDDGRSDAEVTVGLVAPADDDLRADVEGVGSVEVLVGTAASVLDADPDWVVGVGEDALVALAAAGTRVPVLPVDAGPGIRSVDRAAVTAAVGSLLEGAVETVSRTTLDVTVGGEAAGPAVFDVLLTTAEPAHISEYSVRDARGPVGQIRADGVVVATPAGSYGYAGAAGGPHVAPETGVLSVVPIAPFVTDAEHWVVGDERVELTRERDVPVSLVVDGAVWGTPAPSTAVRVGAGRSLPLAATPESEPAAPRGRRVETL